MDRPCSRPASEHACAGQQQKEHHAMPKPNTAIVTIGIDPGKNTLHLVGLDARGGIVLREKVARARIISWLANVPPCLIGIRKSHRVMVMPDGFAWNGEMFDSLSEIAFAITGT